MIEVAYTILKTFLLSGVFIIFNISIVYLFLTKFYILLANEETDKAEKLYSKVRSIVEFLYLDRFLNNLLNSKK